MSLTAGTHLGPYEIHSAIGEGGIGQVGYVRKLSQLFVVEPGK